MTAWIGSTNPLRNLNWLSLVGMRFYFKFGKTNTFINNFSVEITFVTEAKETKGLHGFANQKLLV